MCYYILQRKEAKRENGKQEKENTRKIQRKRKEVNIRDDHRWPFKRKEPKSSIQTRVRSPPPPRIHNPPERSSGLVDEALRRRRGPQRPINASISRPSEGGGGGPVDRISRDLLTIASPPAASPSVAPHATRCSLCFFQYPAQDSKTRPASILNYLMILNGPVLKALDSDSRVPSSDP